ncbi:hypothetical protein CK222_31175 [Mesorhizobium sp. WSM3866]|nr:hypothetical protein CK222_31175 [Mesorhizobium sp. WSM3866]
MVVMNVGGNDDFDLLNSVFVPQLVDMMFDKAQGLHAAVIYCRNAGALEMTIRSNMACPLPLSTM